MKRYEITWQVGYQSAPDGRPQEMMPASVPGAVQLDYARAKGWPPFWKGVNFKDYKWMEDVYWLYESRVQIPCEAGERAFLHFLGIDYRYRILVDGECLADDEGMFRPVHLDVTRFAGRTVCLQVLIFPAPKADDSDTRTQARKSCKSPACYSWDWHPRLVTAGLWDEAYLTIGPARQLTDVDASYTLTDDLGRCDLRVQAKAPEDGPVEAALSLEGKEVVRAEGVLNGGEASLSLSIDKPKLWYPVGYGEQTRYLLTVRVLGEDGSVIDERVRPIGLRRVRLVMNEGSWDEPKDFPKSRSDAPATLEVNGRRLFARGSNWVNAQVFPGTMSPEHYESLLMLVRDAHMNILRIWGGGFVNKESFFELCDELGIMVWQEFPLACNEYPDEEHYLSVLKKEATSIVRRLRTHPCVVLYCGGNELFNKPEVTQRGGNRERYEELIAQNELLAACDIVKEMVAKAYSYRQEKRMRDMMEEVVAVCRGTGNRHFGWFARLVEGHMEGIVAHARFQISSGKVEGTNNTIKSLRRAGYGYPDDEYFFLKIFDSSRRYSPGREAVVA